MKYLLFTFFIIFSSVHFVFANESTTRIKISPENPEPNTEVTLTLESYATDIDTALITWKINGVKAVSGEGERVFNVKVGDIGKVTEVSATLERGDGYFGEYKVSLSPTSVALIYEAPDSHVPLFYEGRSFAATGGKVKVVAFPSLGENGNLIDPSSLSYTWYLNGEPKQELSGKGKQGASFFLDYLRSKSEVSVIIRSPSGLTARKKIDIYAREIEPIVYSYNEILGPDIGWALEKRIEVTKPFSLYLEPYFLTTKGDAFPSYRWVLDGFDVTPFKGRLLGVAPKESSFGVQDLTIFVYGKDKRLQKKETSLQIIFDSR